MAITGARQIDDGDWLGGARNLLGELFDKEIVSALLVPLEGPSQSIMPAIVKDPSRLSRANPFAPVMALNSARLVSALTREDPGQVIGAVLRSCEIRALVELAKFNQVRCDNLVTVGVDCLGTFTVPDYAQALKNSSDLMPTLFASAQSGLCDDLRLRTACRICEQPFPLNADISIGFFGTIRRNALSVTVRDDIAEKLGLVEDTTLTKLRGEALAQISSARTSARDAALDEFHLQLAGKGGIASYLANCVECTNCMNACPMCYCKECFFRTANTEHTPRELLRLAERHGALGMPSDALLFHLTRMNHMATSCVGCGMCEAACPNHLPLTAMFRAVGMRVQTTFHYTPGANVSDKPPFMVFDKNELLEIGEA
jgi:formate dehydrogenase (coenzyme F420) beta subunit